MVALFTVIRVLSITGKFTSRNGSNNPFNRITHYKLRRLLWLVKGID